MHLIQKLFCRAVQIAFHIALPVLPYREPNLIDSIEGLEPELKRLGVSSVMLVTDSFLRTSGATEALEAMLRKAGIPCAVYDKTRANPTVQNVEEALALYKQERCQALIAFGGGSSMDCAKAVGARIVKPKKALYQLRGQLKILKRLPPLIAIPTTAGTGSEVTISAVITDSQRKHKYTMNDFALTPAYAVHDPAVTYTLPQSLTATTGMDALTHAVEAYIGRSTSKETRRLAEEAVKLIFENIETAYQDGRNHLARKNMLRASYAAGIAFSKSYVGYVHAVAHSLGGQYNIPHGLANSVLLPIVLDEYGEAVYKKLHRLGVAAGVAEETDSHENGAHKFIQAIRDMNRRLNIPETLSGIQKEDIPHMAKHAAREANPLYPVPKLMNAAELEQFYHKAADWN